MSSATPDDKSVPDWLDAGCYKTIAARRFADFYRNNLHQTAAANAGADGQGIQEEAARWVLQRLDALSAKPVTPVSSVTEQREPQEQQEGQG